MKTLFLNEFLVLAEQLNFSNAAKKLGINQSSLSRHIRQLEDELQVPLFSRTTQKIELTQYGIAFLPHAIAIREHEKAFECEAEAIRRDASSRISLGVCGFPQYYGITSLFVCFKNQYPDSAIDVHMETIDDTFGQLQSGILDAAFVHSTGILEKNYEVLPFMEDYLSVALPVGHPLAAKESVQLIDLKDEVFYLRHKKGSSAYKFEEEVLRNSGFEPKMSSSKGTWEDSVINRGTEVSLVNQGLAANLRGNLRITVIEIKPRIHTDICLIYPRGRKLSNITKTFVEFTAQSRKTF